MKLIEVANVLSPVSSVESWLKRVGVINYTIRPDGVVDVNGDVNLTGLNMINIPVQFGTVTGNFHCNGNPKLTSLVGSPHRVEGSMNCFRTGISSLHGAPRYIGGNIACDATPNLVSISGIHKIIPTIKGQFWGNSKLTHVLGLLMIDGLHSVDINDGVDAILNKYIANKDRDIISAQEELLDAGFKDQARI